MIRSIAFFLAACFCYGTIFAQSSQTSEIKFDDFTVKLSNIEVVTSPKSTSVPGRRTANGGRTTTGSRPSEPSPLDEQKVYPRDTKVFIKLDFESDFKPDDDAPKGFQQLTVHPTWTKISIGRNRGYLPAFINDSNGTAYIRLTLEPDPRRKRGEFEFALTLRGIRNDKSRPEDATSSERISFKIKIETPKQTIPDYTPLYLQSVRLAKATQNEEDGGEQISLLIRSYETVTAVRMIYVDGAQKEQTYTYQNPTDKSERKDVPIDDVDAWTIDGNRLTKDQLMKALQKPTPVFLYDNKDFPDYVTAPFSSILNPKAIVLRVNRERGTPW